MKPLIPLFILLFSVQWVYAQPVCYIDKEPVASLNNIKTATIYYTPCNDTLNRVFEAKVYYDSLTGIPSRLVKSTGNPNHNADYRFTFYNCAGDLHLKRYMVFLTFPRPMVIFRNLEKDSLKNPSDSCGISTDFYSFKELFTPAERLFDYLGRGELYYYPNGLRRGYIFTEKAGNGAINSRLYFEYEYYKE